MDDGCLIVDMQQNWIANVPTDVHSGSGTFSFADGHAELHRWQTPDFHIPQQSGLGAHDTKFFNVSATNADMQWLRSHSTYHQ